MIARNRARPIFGRSSGSIASSISTLTGFTSEPSNRGGAAWRGVTPRPNCGSSTSSQKRARQKDELLSSRSKKLPPYGERERNRSRRTIIRSSASDDHTGEVRLIEGKTSVFRHRTGRWPEIRRSAAMRPNSWFRSKGEVNRGGAIGRP
jgi:hypothetical protein